ncbi:MAG: SlyX family protein [Phaeovulum sp.]|uniref:SlyX family protein n=1 Tax=Phaeovulum sp. TaxID=2934796 RepID=UPI0027316FD2|nr:SlyX family protein [Phaeovulum sp.]MDP2063943.1 SlyX family protein [Phaeovulum sp.]MDP3862983.1 SlyX family protein [Phaeovulum sp.]
MQRIDKAEEEIAHLARMVEDLSDVVARQEAALNRLERRIGLLIEREAEREAEAGGSVTLTDQRPPHW